MTRLVVVDASLAAKWALPEPYTEQAFELAGRWANEGITLIAPSLILAEISNAIYKRVRRRELDLKTAQQAIRVVLEFGIEIREEAGLQEHILALADELKMPTTYDAHYLALAEKYGCDFWTGDAKLYNLTKAKLPWVRWVGEI